MKAVRVPMESLMEVIRLQLASGEKANLTVTGCSMLPMLREYRDSVQLEPVTGALKPGDIAFYRRDNGAYVLHRVIRVTPEGYLFCGDNQAELETVRQDQMIALVTGYIKKGKLRTMGNSSYRIYCFLWVKLFCVRKCYIWLRRKMGKLRNWILSRRKNRE